jgi:flagellar motor protein MotB
MGTNRNGDRSGPEDFRAATKGLSPALRDALHKSASRNGVQEDDPLWGLMAAQAEVLQAFLGVQQGTLEQGNQQIEQMGKRLDQLVSTSREVAQSRREQQEALRQDEQKARKEHQKATEAGFVQIRQELAKAAQWHLVTVGVAVGLTAALCLDRRAHV